MDIATRIDITNAIRYPQFIKDPFFEGYSPEYKQNGTLKEWGGGFSMVYSMTKGSEKWAFKIWYVEIKNNRQRYSKIAKHIKKSGLQYFMDFEYCENGLFVNNKYLDTLRMKWVNGLDLISYISIHLNKKEVLNKLAEDFLVMIEEFHKNQISHGDLQHENIFITNKGEIKLIDYDSICVPEIEGEKDVSRGRLGFQHPSRLSSGIVSSLKIDYFSQLIILLSIRSVAENPILWDKYKVANADDRLLFTPEDFLKWEDSDIKKDLYHLSDEVKNLVQILEKYLASHLFLPPISDCLNS